MKTSLYIARITVALVCITVPSARVLADSNDTTDTTPAPTVDIIQEQQTTATVLAQPRAAVEIGFVRVVLDEQHTYVYNKRRRLIATLPVSTGLLDSTPVGSFKVFSKSAQTYYSPSPDEKMKWMVRFTKGESGDNIGFHGIPYKVTKQGDIPFFTPVGVEPSSHGCIRARVSDAKWLFDNMALGTPVVVMASRGALDVSQVVSSPTDISRRHHDNARNI